MPKSIISVTSYCNTCKREQAHTIVAKHTETFDDDYNHVSGKTHWEVVKCGGCRECSFRKEFWCSENYDDEGREYPTIDCYPLPFPLEVKDLRCVPRKIREVYKEVLKAFSNDAYVLCAAGLRAIIDGICSHQKIRTGPVKVKTKAGYKVQRRKDLRAKIEGMLERGIITKSHRDILHQHRYLGNEAVHELECPASDELGIAIKIVEHTLEHIYELPETAAELVALSKARKDAKRMPRKKRRVVTPVSSAPTTPPASTPAAAPPTTPVTPP